VREAWDKLIANVTRAEPNIKLDGILVEAMSQRGVELVIGARRDPLWGPILLIGLGGIWVEALRDVRLVPAHANKEQIIKELRQLRSARLLDGFRGMPSVDVDAVAQIAVKIGGLMRARHDIVEIDLNPVMVHAVGQGATALDALIVTH
jgi:acyl-CoA synthetase (NDP forming)